MKKVFHFAAMAAALFLFAGCEKKASSPARIKLVMAEVNPPDTVVGKMDLAFKQKVEELSGGTIVIDLHTNGELGNVEENLRDLFHKESPIDIIRVSVSNLTIYNCQKSALLTLPYTFKTRQQFWNFTNSPMAQEILDEPSELGTNIKGLFFGEEGFRNFFSISPIYSPEDFKGKTVRLPEDPVQKEMIRDFGGTPVQIGFDALLASLKSELADIAEQPTSNYLANSFYTTAPNIIMDGHTLGAVEAIMSVEKWNSLTKEQQDILIEAGKTATQKCHEISEITDQKAIKTLKRMGVKVVEVKDKAPWQKAAEPVQKKYSSRYPELYSKILNLPQ